MVKLYSSGPEQTLRTYLLHNLITRSLRSKWRKFFFPLLNILLAIQLSAQITSPPDPCDTGTEPTCKCETAPILCTIDDLDGFEYSMSTFQHPEDGPNPLCIGVPSVPNNPTWFAFIAWCEELTLLVEVENCTDVCSGTNGQPCGTGPFPCGFFGPPCTRGIQIAVYGNCAYTEQIACDVAAAGCNENDRILNLEGMEIGGIYYFMVDGCAGSACDVRINVVGTCGNAEIEPWTNPIDGPDSVCVSTSGLYTVDNLQAATLYHWYIDGVEIDLTTDPTNEIFFPGEGTFELCVDVSNLPCIEVTEDPEPICMTVEVFYPEDYLGEFIECIENLPLLVEGIPYFESGFYEYEIINPFGCDTLKQLDVEVILHEPQPQDTVVCADAFPFFYPPAQMSIPGAGTYLVPAFDQLGCDSSYLINFYTLEIDIQLFKTDDTLFCPSESITIFNTGLGAFIDNPQQIIVSEIQWDWYLDGELQPELTGSEIEVSEPGEYKLIFTAFYNDLICIDSATIEIPGKFEDPPKPVPLFLPEVCINTSHWISLTNFNGDLESSWEIDGPATFLSQSPDSALIRFDSLGLVEVCIAYNFTDCPVLTSDSCFSIIVTEGLSPSIIGPDYFCEGDSLVLAADQFYEMINWNGMDGDTSITIRQSGTVVLSVTDSFGCSGTAEIEIEEANNPQPQILGSPAFCEEGFAEFSLDEPYNEILWSTGESSAEISINFEGVVSVSVTDELGCSGSASIETLLEDELQVEIVGPSEICFGETSILTTNPSFAEYQWSTGADSDSIEINEDGTYTVEVSDGRGCFGSAEYTLTVNQLPDGELITNKSGLCPDETLLLEFVSNSEIIEYLWSDSSVGNDLNVGAAGPYSLIVTDENGCTAEFEIDLEAFDEPNPLISGPAEFCSGEQVLISVSDMYASYTWSNGQEGNEILVTDGGTYILVVVDENGCTGTDTFLIVENMLPDPQITGPSEICSGENAILGSNQIFENYLWSNGSNEPEITVSEPGTISLEVTDSNGCSNSTEIEFTVNPIPEINFSGSTTFCTGFSSTISIANFPTILWSNGETTNSITINQEGTYSVSVTDENGCQNEAEIAISEDDELQPVISGEPGFCPGESATLEVGSGFESYAWSNGATGSSLSVSIPGNYTITVSDSDGCTGSATVNVVQYDPPEPVIEGDAFLCFGETGLLGLTQQFETYLWNTGALTDQITVSQSGVFHVTVTDENNCAATTQFEVEQNEEIIPMINGPDNICEGDTAEFVGEPGFQEYIWSTGESGATVYTGVQGNYSLTVTDSNGCSGENSFELEIIPLPMVDAGADQELDCLTDIVTLGNPNQDQSPNLVFEWYLEGASVVLGTGLTLDIEKPGSYVLVVTDLNTGCSNSERVLVTRDPTDINAYAVSFKDPVCFGEANGFISIDNIEGGSPPFTYLINGSEISGPLIGNLSAGSFSLTIRDEKGCEVDTIINLFNPPQVAVELGPDGSINFGEDLILEGNVSIGPERIQNIDWLLNGIPECDPCEELTLFFEGPEGGLITLIVTDINGCSDSDQILITVTINRDVYIPNAFSPNNDGVNDLFIVYGPEDLFLVESVEIYDRWGSKVFERRNIPPNDPTYGWDGIFREKELNPGVFLYQVRVRYVDGTTADFTGDLLLSK